MPPPFGKPKAYKAGSGWGKGGIIYIIISSSISTLVYERKQYKKLLNLYFLADNIFGLKLFIFVKTHIMGRFS